MYIIRRDIVFFIYFSTLCLSIVIDASRGYTKQEVRQSKATDYRPFISGLRYGKRMNWDDQPSNDMLSPILCGIYENLSCYFTGVSNLYKCTRRMKQWNEDYSSQK